MPSVRIVSSVLCFATVVVVILLNSHPNPSGENFFVTRFEPNIKLSVNLVEKSYEKLWTVSNWRGHKVPSSTESASIAKKRKQASKKSKAHHSRKAKAVKKESAQPTPTKPIHRRNKLSPDHPSLKTTAHGRVEGTSLLARKRRSALNAKGVATSADKPLSKRPHRVCKGAMGSGGGKAKNRPASGFVHAVQTTSQRWVPVRARFNFPTSVPVKILCSRYA